jgi:predicted AAA+ superfamily ATPase
MNYLDVMEVTQVVSVLRPYHKSGARELTHQPKIFAFDTGFVAWSRGWNELRAADSGQLWEHVVFETLQACVVPRGVGVHSGETSGSVRWTSSYPPGGMLFTR